jgi:glutaredoxin-like protein NrdH
MEVTNMAVNHVAGKNAGHIMLYALSTCGWCAKTRQLLEDMGVAYDYEYVDHLQGEDKKSTMQVVEKWNPRFSFPTIVIGDKKCIVGFKEDEIRGALKK